MIAYLLCDVKQNDSSYGEHFEQIVGLYASERAANKARENYLNGHTFKILEFEIDDNLFKEK